MSLIPRFATVVLLSGSLVCASAQITGDYRSAGSGDWSAASTWQRFDGITFVAASVAPNATDGVITIRAGHTVTASTFLTADQVLIENGATLNHTAGGFTVADGALDDIQVFGTLIHSGNGFSGPGNIRIMSGGTFQWTGGGQLNADLVLDLDQGSTASTSSTSPLLNNGTINNGGTWTLVNGGFSSTVLPGTFHNLGTGIVELDGWATPANSWAQTTLNDGIINKNNGDVTFTTTGRPWTNNGTINVPQGTFTISGPGANSNAGDIVFGGPGTVLRTNAAFTNAAGGSITGLGHLQLQSGTCTMAAGSSMNMLDTLTVATFSTLVVEQDVDAEQVNFTGGTINGTGALSVPSGGQLNWTGGSNNATLNIGANATATFLVTSTVSNSGTINNAGTFLMEGGNISQLTTPCRFNNLPSGVVELNGWTSTTSSWIQNVFNQGIINKNNGAVQFTFSFPVVNEPGGVINANSGNLALTPSFSLPVQSGVFNVMDGASLSANTNGIPYAGPQFNNNGAVNATLKFEGGSPQQLNGTGTITNLTINNASGVDLGGEHTVTGTLTLTTGQLRLGANDLFVENNAAGSVAGGNANSWVVNDGTGSLHRQVSGNNFLFPIGTSSYTPMTLSTTGPQDRFQVRVQDGVAGEYGAPGEAISGVAASDVVDRTWVVSEQVQGGNAANITVQWNSGDELTGFNRSDCAMTTYDGTDWTLGTLGPATGSGPFTRTVTGLSNFRELCVADGDATLNDLGTGVEAIAAQDLRTYPLPASEDLYIELQPNNGLRVLRLLDESGRMVLSTSVNGASLVRIPVGQLNAGTYVLMLEDEHGDGFRRVVTIVH